MVNYDNSKIYKIQGGSMLYIGSTTKQYLSQRWSQHKSDYLKKKNKTSAWNIFDSVGIDKCSIILLETFPCKSVDELRARERYWIEKENCVNRCIPGRTKEEYYLIHKNEAIEKTRRWIVNNKDKRKQWESMIIECPCGIKYTQSNKSRHLKSKAHDVNLPH